MFPMVTTTTAVFGECLMHISQVVGSTSSPQAGSEGLYFCDGQRKVDYVLVFHHRRHGSIRCPLGSTTSQDQLSVVSNGNFPQTVGSDAVSGRGGGILVGDAVNAGDVFMELGNARGSDPMEPADHEMHLIRQEFEANLLEAGLEIERDREVGVCEVLMHTVCFFFLILCYYCINTPIHQIL